MEEETQSKRDEEIVRNLQARVLREEWEKREELERLQDEQKKMLEEEREKRVEFERLQREKEEQLKGFTLSLSVFVFHSLFDMKLLKVKFLNF